MTSTRRMVALLGATLALAGCPAHVKGLVRPLADGGTVLETGEGQAYALELQGRSAQLAFLDGHLTEVWGRGGKKRLIVERFRVHRGVAGMSAYLGVLALTNGELVLQDPETVGVLRLDDGSLSDLLPHVGLPVLVEGYVEGAQRVKVVKFRVLADTTSRGKQPGE